MKFLLYSQCGEGAQVLKKIELEGNEVGIFIKDKIYKSTFEGLLPHVQPDAFVDTNTVILFDMSGNGAVADTYKRKGHFTYGASSFADDLEHDRAFGFSAMEQAGIKIPDHKEFKDFKQGLEYVRSANKRLVFKPCGSMPTKLTYVSKDAKELESYMKFVESRFGKDIDSFILQDFIEGVVVSSEFFCNGKEFIRPCNHTVEVKKSMNDELGPSTGCSGNITWACDEDPIIKQGVLLVEALCVKHGYVGQIDLNAVVSPSGVYGLEWTPRWGYDATPTLLTLLDQDFGEFFSNMARGQCKEMKLLPDYAGGLRITIPPYPAEPLAEIDPEEFSPNLGVPIQNYEAHEEDLYFYEVKLEDCDLVHSGGTGVVACAMGLGATPEECMKGPLDIAKDLVIPDKQYRTDLTDVLAKMVKETENYA